LETTLRSTLDELAERQRLRQLKTISAPERPEITLNHQRVVDFCNNDYLGFSQHPRLIEAAKMALETYGAGSTGARLIGGTLDLHTQLEADIAALKGTEAALVFNSGYQANVGVLSALVGRHDLIFSDRLNHASLVDGALLSRAKQIRYPHLDMEALEKRLKAADKTAQKFIVTDSVFSMDGDLAPLSTLFALAEKYQAWLIIDEAHGTGVFGKHHRSGLWETTGIGPQDRVIQIGTFSKALGSFGAYVAASRDVIDTLIQFSRSFVYSTALPPSVIAANIAALDLLKTDPDYTQILWDNLAYFRQQTQKAGLMFAIESPIIPVLVGDTAKTLDYAQALLDAGLYVQAIRPPTVPEGTARLRVTITAKHGCHHLDQLVQALGVMIPNMPLI
jgi:glycine C-acetyltransferase